MTRSVMSQQCLMVGSSSQTV